MSGEMKSLIIWVKCPQNKPTHQSIKYCFKCDYFAGTMGDKLMCIFEEK